MSEHNALKYFPNLSRLGERAFGVDDNEQSITRLSETLQGVADLWNRPEWALHRGENLFARAPATIPAVVARNSILSLVNPAGSGIIACVTGVLMLSGSVVIEMQTGSGGSIAANPVNTLGIALDTRFRILGEASTCTITTGDVASGVALPQWAWLGASSNQLLQLVPVILIPGFKLDIICPTQNTAMRLALLWWERKAFPGELSS